MLRSLTKCINCGADKAGFELCPFCGVAYAKAEKAFFEKLKEELRKEGYEHLAADRQPRKEDE